jgi:hypothetical protein
MLTSEPADPGIARPDWHLVGNSSVEKIWVRFVKPAYVRSITACLLGHEPTNRTSFNSLLEDHQQSGRTFDAGDEVARPHYLKRSPVFSTAKGKVHTIN